MTKVVNLIIALFIASSLLAQNANTDSDAMNTCEGAINIFENGDFQLQFTGKKNKSSIDHYPSLGTLEKNNQLWCSYIAPASGELAFKASKKEGFIQMVIFSERKNDICGEIVNGSAEIERLHTSKNEKNIGLDLSISDGYLYVLKLNEGEKINVLFTTGEDLKDDLFLSWNFNAHIETSYESKVVDKRNDDFATTLKILVRDKNSNRPLVANLSIEGSKEIDAFYTGSDFFFNITRNSKMSLKCDLEGYFFIDKIEDISANDDHEIIFQLEPISSGKSMKIEEIEFQPGSSEIVLSSEPKLKRLKDFLALNSDINIEIQGHVFADGDNTIAAQKVSEARAKKVMKYLIDNGIDKIRLTSVGYGNTKPIYAKPKFSYEEQANRRVEILIK